VYVFNPVILLAMGALWGAPGSLWISWLEVAAAVALAYGAARAARQWLPWAVP
jgi:hypothetical protein